MNKIVWIYVNHMASDSVNGTRIRSHYNRTHGEWGWCQHHFLSGRNTIDRNKFGLDDGLQVGNFMFQKLIMVHQAVPVILNSDKIFQAEGQPAPGMGFKFGQIDKKVTLGNRFGHIELVS